MNFYNTGQPYPASDEYSARASDALQCGNDLVVSDSTGEASFASQADLDAFWQSGSSVAELLDERLRVALTQELHERMPPSELADGIASAVSAVLSRLQAYSRERVQSRDTSDEERYELMRSERDLNNALSGIIAALDLYAPPDAQVGAGSNAGYFYDTYAWYREGKRTWHGGFATSYEVCNDTYYPDDEDHLAELTKIREDAEAYGVEEVWPDEFYHPAILEIRVDPEKRIEFIYTPTVESAKARHASRSEVTMHDGKVRIYENTSLSIRVDLDPTAPNGIAVDVGRSEYHGERDGRRMDRDADLLGSVLSRTSGTGSHEYEGLSREMADGFGEFAERFAVHLDLQNKEYLKASARRQLGQAGLRAAS